MSRVISAVMVFGSAALLATASPVGASATSMVEDDRASASASGGAVLAPDVPQESEDPVPAEVQVPGPPVLHPHDRHRVTSVSTPRVVSIAFSPDQIAKGRISTASVTVVLIDDVGIDRFHLLRVADCPPSGVYDEWAMRRISSVSTSSGVMETWIGSVTFPAVVPAAPRKVLVEAFDGAANRLFHISDCIYLPALDLPVEAPTSPRGVEAVGSASGVLVSWQAPASDGGAPVTGYVVTAFPGGGRCSTAGALSCTVTGLTNGLSYTFSVTATNSAGTSPPSAPSSPITPTTVPSNPIAVSATAEDGQAVVSWQAPASDGGAPVTGYVVTAFPGGGRCSTAGALSCTVTGLTNGLSYTFSVTATNSAGTSPPSAPSLSVTPMSPVTQPGVVTRLKATSLKGALRVTWGAPLDLGGVAPISYQYRVGKKAWLSTSARMIRVPGAPEKVLAVAVRAVNAAGPGESQVVRATPK